MTSNRPLRQPVEFAVGKRYLRRHKAGATELRWQPVTFVGYATSPVFALVSVAAGRVEYCPLEDLFPSEHSQSDGYTAR